MASKRQFDVVVSALAIVLLLPVFLLVGAVVALSMGRPVLFRQTRPGLDGALFTIFKFRTMHDPTEAGAGAGGDTDVDMDTDVVNDADRMTRVGAFLRATTLDELPQFINVLRGDMSLVGPRPLPATYLDRYTPTQARRHEVRPGMTGLAQVTGRNRLAWSERFELDVEYVDHRSWALDLRIMARTIGTVLSGRGVSANGHATMPEFRGKETSTSPTASPSPIEAQRSEVAA